MPERTALSTTSDVTATTGEASHRPDPADIVYVIPEWLPDGWTAGHATLRVGPPEDYTAVWRPAELTGTSRSDSTEADGQSVWVNVGAAAYSQSSSPEELDSMGFGLEDAEVEEFDGYRILEFRVGCCVVSLGTDHLEAAGLRRIAEGVRAVDRGDWDAHWGRRLLIDDNN